MGEKNYSLSELLVPELRITEGGKQEEKESCQQVDHPAHYNKGKIEVIDFIEDQQLGFALGNVVKYVCRAGSKPNEPVERDLQKAMWYLGYALKAARGASSDATENPMSGKTYTFELKEKQ